MSMNSDVDSKKFHFSVREPDIRIKVIMISKDLTFENHYPRQKVCQSVFYFVIICPHFLVRYETATILGSTSVKIVPFCFGIPGFGLRIRDLKNGRDRGMSAN